MNEKPVIFSGPMVKAILAGAKTQTRRVIKPQPPEGYRVWGRAFNGHVTWTDHPYQGEKGNNIEQKCPYGQEGDRLWVRETFSLYRGFGADVQPGAPVIYRADEDKCGQYPAVVDGRSVLVNARDPWKPSIFMPRWASRLTLEVTDVRVERLQDISEDDAKAEGMEIVPIGTSAWTNRQSFSILWNKINGARGYTWDSNPFVWVVSFSKVEP